ncbi:MAG TPA: hypothetical protein VF178_03245 [Gemmatimonadaceae bacterium]
MIDLNPGSPAMNDTICPTCGLSADGGAHTSEAECVAALRVRLVHMEERLTAIERLLDDSIEREWVLRNVLPLTAYATISNDWAKRCARWLGRQTDPELLKTLLTSQNPQVRRLIYRYVPAEAWTESLIEQVLPEALPAFAERRILPRSMATEDKLRQWIQPIPTAIYYRSRFVGEEVAAPVKGLVRGGYPLPEKLWKEVARIAGRPVDKNEASKRVALALAALSIPDLTVGNVRNIAGAFLRAGEDLDPKDFNTEAVFASALAHSSCPESLPLALADASAPVAAQRAVAKNARWRHVAKVRHLLVRSTDAHTLLGLCEDPEISADEFRSLFRRAAGANPAAASEFLEHHAAPHLVAEDLAPLLRADSQEIRLKAIAYLSGVGEAAGRQLEVESPRAVQR